MGGGKSRVEQPGLAYYGSGYDPYYPYGGLENYGSAYQPIDDDYGYGYGTTEGPFALTTRPRRRGGRQAGMYEYGTSYPPGFNPVLQGLTGRPKIRIIFMPNNLVSGLQNLAQQGVGAGMNPLQGGLGNINPSSNPIGGINPLMMGGFGGFNPMMMGGAGGAGFPQMMPQMPYGSPMVPQASMSQLGSNCFSVSLQVPSMGGQMPMPCPPPMIQPMMSQMPIAQPAREYR